MPLSSSAWSPGSWREKPIQQQPIYSDLPALKRVEGSAGHLSAIGLRRRNSRISTVNWRAWRGQRLSVGGIAESFDEFNASKIKDTFKVILQMAIVLTFAGKCPVTKAARMAGQYAKPRSSDTETIGSKVLPATVEIW